jgi:hypothetical protein
VKPAQARRLREAREAAQAARGEALEAFLDDLERAALTPAALFRLSFVSPEDLERLRARMAGRSEVETG